MPLPRSSRRRAAAAALPLLMAGCMVGPDYQSPAAPSVDRFTEAALPPRTTEAATAGGTSQVLAQGRDIPGDWWAMFHSPEITALVTRALRANPDIAAAQATLREAQENARAAQGGLFPQISAGLNAARQQSSLASSGGSGTSLYSVITGSLNVAFTLDAFGGIRRQVEALDAQADYQRYIVEATNLTLAADVVIAAITEAELAAQIATTRDIIRTYTAARDVTSKRFELGGVSQVDVLQQQSLLDAQVATLPALQKQLEQERNQMAVYLGGLPSQYGEPTLDLDKLTLPPEVPVSLPSRLVEQRPDVRAYAALLHAATAQVGVAIANTLPQISLTGSYGRDGSSLSNLFTPGGIIWSIASSLTQPIFEGGTLQARKRAAVAALDVAAAQYSSTVNTAFQGVANALVAIQRDAETLKAALAAQKTAAASLAAAQSQYSAGAGSYLNVLTAEQSDQAARLYLITAQATRFTDTVALFQALGGGWWNRQMAADTSVR
jgi:NodT family efflux transporter outer membrane factor (OMF) lipoprotein